MSHKIPPARSLPLTPEGNCPICHRPPSSPFTRIVGERFVNHCLHDCHGGSIPVPSQRADFYRRGRKLLKKLEGGAS